MTAVPPQAITDAMEAADEWGHRLTPADTERILEAAAPHLMTWDPRSAYGAGVAGSTAGTFMQISGPDVPAYLPPITREDTQ